MDNREFIGEINKLLRAQENRYALLQDQLILTAKCIEDLEDKLDEVVIDEEKNGSESCEEHINPSIKNLILNLLVDGEEYTTPDITKYILELGYFDETVASKLFVLEKDGYIKRINREAYSLNSDKNCSNTCGISVNIQNFS